MNFMYFINFIARNLLEKFYSRNSEGLRSEFLGRSGKELSPELNSLYTIPPN